MKRSLEEILEKTKTILGDNTSDEALSLIEDITDSYSLPEVDWEQKYNENDAMWRQKYRDRFYSGVPQEKEDFFEDEKPSIKTKFEELFEEV